MGQAPSSANVASLRNGGLELALNYRNSISKFRYDVGVNFTKVSNEVTSLGGASPIASGNVISQFGNTTLTGVGREIAYFNGLKTDGIFRSEAEVSAYTNAAGTLIQPDAQPGDVRYRDVYGNGLIDDQDRTYLGSATPNFSYGMNLSLGYGGLDFKILLYGVQGAEAINGQSFNLLKSSSFASTWNNFSASRLDRWTPSNLNADQPRMTAVDDNGNDQFSSRYVEDASYLRARNIELGYSLPTPFTTRYGIGGVRFYASVDNVFTITKYTGLDPEISAQGFYNNPLAYGVDFGNYPQPRTYRLGLNVQF
ncbi:hypothetical protein [uncultured Hymenobacter sp.]|uniref:hypothetical protein n=1 Tax=uncultured Hymenobacter sp. TaxID=170016 RepID=UPI0035C9B473